MNFGRWHPLPTAAGEAPNTPGIFQVRQAKGLIDYPRGKSAMLYYGYADDMGAAIASYATANPDTDWWCRHSVDMSQHDVDHLSEAFDRLVAHFEQRFGRRPSLPT